MQNNDLFLAAKDSKEYLQQLGFSGGCLTERPPCLPDLNQIQNLWHVLKRRVYQDEQQFSSKVALWDAVVDAAQSMAQDDIIILTNLMYQCVKKNIACEGSYIKHEDLNFITFP